MPEEALKKLLRQTLQAKTDISDTHPCLTERLKHLGVACPECQPGPLAESAAMYYLGQTADKLTSFFDEAHARAVAAGA